MTFDIRQLKAAKEYAIQYGVKAVCYGPAGSGKTPVINSAPRPVLLACEPGLLSMRNSNVPTAWCLNSAQIDDFCQWCFHSNESKNFDTVCIDSGTQMAEVYLSRAESKNAHGLAAYGQMSRDTYKQLESLFYLQQKHVYLICKQEIIAQQGITMKRPYFPGRELPVKVPHLYDCILQLDMHNVPGIGQVKAFRCQGSMDTIARNRTGTLNEFEEPHFGKLVAKAMQ